MWAIKVDESQNTETELDLLLQNEQILDNEDDRIILKPGDILTYDKYHGTLIEVLSVRGNIVEVKLPEKFDRRYLQLGIHLFKIEE